MKLRQALKAGAGWLYLHAPLPQRLHAEGVILMLHRVIADDRAAALPHRNELCLGSAAFERLLRWLRRHFDCVPLMELLDPNAAPPSGRLRVALTFDDGWRDNATHAFPLLQRYQMPASIFLSTDFVGSQRAFWWESIGETLWGTYGPTARNTLCAQLREAGAEAPAALFAQPDQYRRSLLLAQYLQCLKQQPAGLLQALADQCPDSLEPQALDWQQVRQLEDSGLIRFGPHGASHAILTGLDHAQLERELQDSSRLLRQRCRRPLPVYCYPNGDHDEQVRRQLARHHEYRHALSTRPGLFRGRGDNLALPRIGVSQRTAQRPELLAWRMLSSGRQ
jgi:peptidoglycan/xylan/chitin deacetylase (PgdA/CDA1 family)